MWMSSAVEWLEIWSTPRLAEADSLDIFVAYITAVVATSVVFLVSGYMKLLLWDVAPVLSVGWTTKNKKAGTSRVVFLDWTLRSFFFLNSCKEGKERKTTESVKTKKPHKPSKRIIFLGFLETLARFRDASVINDHACSGSSDILLQTCAHSWETFSNPFRTCRVGILVEIKAPSFQKRIWHDEICSNDLLNVFTWGEGEIWDLTPAAAAKKTKIFAPHR